MYYAEGYNGPTEADMQRLTINDSNARSFSFNQPSNAGEEHSKFLKILLGNMDREILDSIEIDS